VKLLKKGKAVDYFGVALHVDVLCHTLATDSNGHVYAYSDFDLKPTKRYGYWDICGKATYHIATVDLEGMDWRDTLMSI
jgi:hypothetical protein